MLIFSLFSCAIFSNNLAASFNAVIALFSPLELPPIACANYCAAASTASLGVTDGEVRYLCLKISVSAIHSVHALLL